MTDHTIFAPHRVCLMFNQRLIWTDVITDGLVALAYYSVLAALFIVAVKRKNSVPMRPLLILFGLFIALCGAGHALDSVTLWKPIYWIKDWWNAGTAVTSVATAIVLIPKVAEFLNIPKRTAQLKQEKKLLREQHGILQAILHSVSEGILLADREGQVFATNPAASQILGDPPRVDWTGPSTGGLPVAAPSR